MSPVLDYVPPEDRGRSLHFNGEEDPWVGLHRHFVDRVRDGGPVITDGAFGRQVMEVILAGYESSRQGRRVVLPAQ